MKIKIPTIQEEREYADFFKDMKDFSRKHKVDFVLPVNIEQEYDIKLYKKAKKYLETKMELIRKKLAKVTLKHREYTVYISQYGPGGTYNQDFVTVRIDDGKFAFEPVKNIIHEIIHIQVEDLVGKLPHQDKEEVVSLITEKIMASSD